MARWEIAVAAKNAHRQGECCDLEGLAWHHINPVCRLRVRGNGLPGFVSLTITVLLPSFTVADTELSRGTYEGWFATRQECPLRDVDFGVSFGTTV